MAMQKLTDNFYLEEFTQSDTATRKGINNTPNNVVLVNLKILAENMEQVRTLLTNPIFINSGYRSIELNKAIGGVSTSAHCLGYAADFTCRKFGTPDDIVSKIRVSKIKFDQLIEEGTWVHISFDPRMRQQTLRATFDNGKATYKAWA